MAKVKKEQSTPKNPNDWQPKDWAERLGKKMRIRQQDIELFKMSLLRDMR